MLCLNQKRGDEIYIYDGETLIMTIRTEKIGREEVKLGFIGSRRYRIVRDNAGGGRGYVREFYEGR